jgi:hypothetical protein
LLERPPAQGTGTAHLDDKTQARLATGQGHQGRQFGIREDLTFQNPKHDGCLAIQQDSQLGHDPLNLANGGTATDALVAEVGRSHTMQLHQKGLWVAKAPS